MRRFGILNRFSSMYFAIDGDSKYSKRDAFVSIVCDFHKIMEKYDGDINEDDIRKAILVTKGDVYGRYVRKITVSGYSILWKWNRRTVRDFMYPIIDDLIKDYIKYSDVE